MDAFLFLDESFDFIGAKMALFLGDRLLVSLRDDIPTIPWPNTWDLPGGGREGAETPFECAAREVWEELGLRVAREEVIWAKIYPSMLEEGKRSVFLVERITQEQYDQIVFGDEGQGYKLIQVTDFVVDETVIPQLRQRVRDYLEARDDRD